MTRRRVSADGGTNPTADAHTPLLRPHAGAKDVFDHSMMSMKDTEHTARNKNDVQGEGEEAGTGQGDGDGADESVTRTTETETGTTATHNFADIAEYEAQVAARKRQQRLHRHKRLKRNMIFKCVMFLVMVAVALFVKRVQEFLKQWQGQ